MVAKVIAFSFLLALAGCATPSGSFCQIAKPVRLAAATIAAMSDAEINAALAHNERGERLCGWKP